ncbi:ATP-dependent DNA helicase RecG [Candidatus Dojkabacteria bacterium]|nr:ATP-dependent DNA helicase RecG [Candidatus Dojkabacteria bacterium]
MIKIDNPATTIPLIGNKYAHILEYLGINTVKDLIYYFPVRFEDSSKVQNISSLNMNEKITFKAEIIKIKSLRLRGKRSIQKGILQDETGQVEAVWFNQPYLTNNLKENEWYLFRGKLNPRSYRPQISSPEYEKLKIEEADTKALDNSNVHLGRLTPIYPLTEGISSKWLRSRVKWAIDRIGKSLKITDPLPIEILKKYNLAGLLPSLKWIHFPESEEQIEKARKRLGFDEMLSIQLRLERNRRKRKAMKSFSIEIKNEIQEKLMNSVDFKPTKSQLTAISEINSDLAGSRPMNRLLQGDVGSGKTLVSVEAVLQTANSGLQSIILVPTSVLADQHYETFNKFLKYFGFSIALVTGNTKKNKPADIIIGTHAILHRKKEMIKNPGLVVIDEQHRFGVEQRRELLKDIDRLPLETNQRPGETRKTANTTTKRTQSQTPSSTTQYNPHLLTMTATPIPRSMALTLFGDMDISTMEDMPEGRTPTKTHLVPDEKREDSYAWIREKMKEGIKVFWITPLIEQSEKLETKSAVDTFELLSKTVFPEQKIRLLHGRIKETEKKNLLKDFMEGKFDILVSTSVIEVGIDIPGAEIIVIEGAERFGLAQLHQLRGRVGRRKNESWCFLFTSTGQETEEQTARLKYFAKENDGLKIAEYDLSRRGPGEVYGFRQSGVPNLKIAKLNDLELIKKTREAARLLIG